MGYIYFIWVTSLFSTKTRIVAWKILIDMGIDSMNSDEAVTNNFVINCTISVSG